MKPFRIIAVILVLLLSSQTIFAGRYYDSATGRFISVDPHTEKYPDVSPYSYSMNNPLKFIDPDGKDIFIVHNKEGASGYGHSAVLIGNDKNGWTLYSKNGEKSGSGKEHYDNGVKFNSLSDFANNESQAKCEIGVGFSTDSETDAQARTVAGELVIAEYDISGANCADLTSDVFQSVGIDVGKPQTTVTVPVDIPALVGPHISITLSKTFTDPKAQIEQAKKIDGARTVNLDKLRDENKNGQ